MMPSRVPEMINLFSKFRIMGASELALLVGPTMSRVHVNRYIRKLVDLGLVMRRTHPRHPIIAYEATHLLMEHALPEKSQIFREQKDHDLRHRLKCTETLIHLCKRENVSGVAIEHELNRFEIQDFSPGRRPDGLFQLSRPGRELYEVALEIELDHKGEDRNEKILKTYAEMFTAGKSLCRGVLFVVPDPFAFEMFVKQCEKMPAAHRNRVLITNKTDLTDLDEKIFGAQLESAYLNRFFSCFSKRFTKHNNVKYLVDRTGAARLRTHRDVFGRQTERMENSS